ncbi:hypothetical protein BT63DRAFT_448440 [Microthyrium microscopicum]|uniref:Uncharacterized protein n=1 Tax=Microthyrium microscopicum TaxID=703497 RepID=A0A6A6U1P3_9PEZI|nr:hypothetical protein BT63DRAFT_448440 [Microthyrium microscopicum]
MSVNRPTDVKFKEQDVNNKLQAYGIYSAFAKGKAPSNKQIDVALNSALASKALTSPPEKLSDEGKKLVGDVREVIEQAKLLLLSKNSGNLLQEFIWETQQITAGDAALPGAPVDKDTAKQHGNEALEGLRTLGTLVISNGQFRKLLSDAAILMRSMAGDAATNAAQKVSPDEEKLAQIDQPAEDNTWHEVPEFNKDQLKSKIPFGKKDVKDVANAGTAAAHPDGSTDPADTANLAAHEQQTGEQTGINAAGGADAAGSALNQKLDEKAPEAKGKVKNKAKEYNARSQNYLKGKMPKERREQTIWRLKKMIVEVQGHADYQRAIETLLNLAETYTGHTKSLATQGQGTIKGAHTDDSLKTAEANLKTLLERFANGTSSDDFFDSLNQIYRDADSDPELKGWFKDVDAYIRRCLLETGYIIQDQSNDDFNALYDKGQYLLRNKYKTHTDRIFDEIKYFGNQFDADAQNTAFGNAVQKLFLDLGNDETGRSTFKPHLLKDVTETILPLALASAHYIPIPRLEYSDPMVDLIVENLIIESDNLTPNVFELGSDNHFKWGRTSANKSSNKNKVMLAVSGVQMDLRDVSFYVNKKEGFPSIKDQGLCDIFMGGDGFSFKIGMETADKTDRGHFFKVNTVNVGVKNFNIKLKQSKHKFLFALVKPLILRAMRPALQKVLEQVIKQKFHELDGIAYEIHQEAQKAKRDAKANPDPENLKNMYQQYFSAAQRRMTQAKQKKEKVQASMEKKKFNAAMTQHDSIFPDITLTSGISTKATEYKELAAKGDRWESPVFSIGSASESTNIPAAPQVTRKSMGKSTGAIGATGTHNGPLQDSTYNAVSNGFANGANSNGVNHPALGSNAVAGPGAPGFGAQVDRAFDPTRV